MHDGWAVLITGRVVGTRASDAGRQLLPQLVRGWELDVELEAIKTPQQVSAWAELYERFFPQRNRIVHEGEGATWGDAVAALECSQVLHQSLLEALAARLDMRWPEMSWNKSLRRLPGGGEVDPADPFQRK